jgi:regulator of protease activity HflC (stomatin/prohibitin superfamily)
MRTVIVILLGSLVLFVLIALLASARVTVFEYERALLFRGGRFRRVLGPGVYWHVPALARIQKIDVRPTRLAVTGQEVLTADGVPIKGSVVGTYAVADPARAVLAADDYRGAVHMELQLALRAIVSETKIDDLLAQRSDLSARLKGIAAEKMRATGIELQEAAIRDLTFPGELKKIFTQVVKARQEGLAALEKARGETAALRNLANAAQMIERNPHLMQVRLLQVLAQQPGNTVVLGLQPSGTPIPVAGSSTRDLTAPPEPPDAE